MRTALVGALVVQGTLCTLVSTVIGWRQLFVTTDVGNALTIPLLSSVGIASLALAYLVNHAR